MTMRSKKYSEQNVYEASLERIEYLYSRFDKIVVSFSGGKDSTAVLNLTIEVARKLGKLPVHAVFVDEEALHPPTVEYVKRVRNHPDVKLDWYCLPVVHRNACSNEQPFWTCWNPEERDLWVREMPEFAITEHPNFKVGDSFQEWMPRMFPPEVGSVCVLTGIRTQESLRRFRIIAMKKNDAYITTHAENGNSYRAHPIYDWTSEDVWKLVQVKNLDYNHTYDVFNKTAMYNKLLTQRVCPPYGEEPLRGLWIYAECWPELWHKMLARVKGVATAWRYANTDLYSNYSKPEDMTWEQYCWMVVETYTDPEHRQAVEVNIRRAIKRHTERTDYPIDDSEPNMLTGCSWKFLAKLAIKGDFKGRQIQAMSNQGHAKMVKAGLTLDQVREIYERKPADKQG